MSSGDGWPTWKGERNWEIYRLRMSSTLTYGQIGERYGLCGERVRQICLKVARIERTAKMKGTAEGGNGE